MVVGQELIPGLTSRPMSDLAPVVIHCSQSDAIYQHLQPHNTYLWASEAQTLTVWQLQELQSLALGGEEKEKCSDQASAPSLGLRDQNVLGLTREKSMGRWIIRCHCVRKAEMWKVATAPCLLESPEPVLSPPLKWLSTCCLVEAEEIPLASGGGKVIVRSNGAQS